METALLVIIVLKELHRPLLLTALLEIYVQRATTVLLGLTHPLLVLLALIATL